MPDLQLVKKSPHFMEPAGLFPHLQAPANCPYSKPVELVDGSRFHFLKIHFSIFLLSMSRFSKWSLSLRSPHQNPVYTSPTPIRAACAARLILLDLITRMIFGEV